jgi:hypothetical protein
MSLKPYKKKRDKKGVAATMRRMRTTACFSEFLMGKQWISVPARKQQEEEEEEELEVVGKGNSSKGEQRKRKKVAARCL